MRKPRFRLSQEMFKRLDEVVDFPLFHAQPLVRGLADGAGPENETNSVVRSAKRGRVVRQLNPPILRFRINVEVVNSWRFPDGHQIQSRRSNVIVSPGHAGVRQSDRHQNREIKIVAADIECLVAGLELPADQQGGHAPE